MKSLFNLWIIFFIVSCASYQSHIDQVQRINFPEIETVQVEVVRGHLKEVTLKNHHGFDKKLYCDDQRVGLQNMGDHLRGFISGPYYFDESFYSCHLVLKKDGHQIEVNAFDVTINDFEFESERLNVDRRHVELSEEDLKRWQNEQKELTRVYANLSFDKVYFSENFSRPLNSVITSPYGRERVFNDKQTSWHSGVDFRAWYDTPIPSSNRGRVVFAGDLFFNGKTVIIDHGLGIVSLYCHLNEIQVEVGEIVPKGQIVGLSGNTGRTTAPHLHWGIKIAGNWINGLALVDHEM